MSRKPDHDVFYKRDEAWDLSQKWRVERELAERILVVEKRGGVTFQPTEEQILANGQESERLLRQEFGIRTDKVMERMKSMISERPRLKEVLDSSGAGNHQGFVLPLARGAAALLDAE